MDLELEVRDSELLACQFVIHLLGLPPNQGSQGIVFSMGKNQGKRKIFQKIRTCREVSSFSLFHFRAAIFSRPSDTPDFTLLFIICSMQSL